MKPIKSRHKKGYDRMAQCARKANSHSRAILGGRVFEGAESYRSENARERRMGPAWSSVNIRCTTASRFSKAVILLSGREPKVTLPPDGRKRVTTPTWSTFW